MRQAQTGFDERSHHTPSATRGLFTSVWRLATNLSAVAVTAELPEIVA